MVNYKEYIEYENIVKQLANNNLNYYIPLASPEYKKPLHLSRIVEILNRILNGEVLKVCFSVPPQHWKSVTVGHLIANYLNKFRKHHVTYASYEQKFAESQTRLPKRLLKEYHNINPIIDTSKEFVLSEGGSLFTTSTNGVMTGKPQSLIILDDLIKNSAEASSKVYRDRAYDWFFSAVDTRERENETSLVLFMTRWHKDDLIGRLIKENYDIINIRIPALYDGLDDNGNPTEPIKELDSPLYYSKEFYEKKKKQSGYFYYAMYQGLPINKGESIFQDAYFYNELPNKVRYSIGTDLAYTTKTKSDYSVAVVMAENDGLYYIVDVLRWQSDINETFIRLKQLQSKYNVPISVESNGVQKAVADMIKKQGIRTREVNPTVDKVTRSQEYSSNWNLGKILVKEGATWLNDYLEELYSFSGINDTHDDQVDASVYAFNQLTKSKGIIMKW